MSSKFTDFDQRPEKVDTKLRTSAERREFENFKAFFAPMIENVQAGKGPTRRQGSGQKTPQIVKDSRRASREVHKDVSQKSAGPQSTKKGDKGYNRKQKHKNSDETISEELTPVDETYRGVGFPMAETLSWGVSEARPCNEGEDPRIGKCNPNTPPENPGQRQQEITLDDEYVPNDQLLNLIDSPSEQGQPSQKPKKWAKPGSDRDYYERTLMGNIAAALDWSTHKSETFDDTGEKGEHPAWGLKSVIDRGVKTHEKPSGADSIEDAEHQTTQRSIPSKDFKSYSMVGAFNW